MSEDDVLNQEFLASLQSEYQHVRENRVDGLLGVAGAATFDAKTRRRYLDAALAFDPNGMATTLHDIMCREASAIGDRRGAASLYLHGGSMGWWQTPAAERARALIAPEKEKPMKATKTRKTNFAATAKSAARKDDVRLYAAITQACAHMGASAKDPSATDEAKIEAIARFFRIVGLIAPDELDASLAKAAEKLDLTPNHQGVH